MSAGRVEPGRVEPGYMGLKELAIYSGLSRNTLRQYIDADPSIALPHFRPPGGGKVLVRKTDFDAWLGAFRSVGRPKLVQNLKELGLHDVASALRA